VATDVATREALDPERAFDPSKVSPSRVNCLAECGVAFRMKYLERIPETVVGSWALFGSVIHKALEKWAVNREQDLLKLVEQAWVSETEGTAVKRFIEEYASLSTEAIKFEHDLRQRRPELTAPRRTKEWKESDVAKGISRLLAVWIPRLETGSPWRFTSSDPLPSLYDESRVAARRYEARWRHLPPALHTEFAFDVPWRGFRLTGYIDAIEPLIDRETGEFAGIGVIDYKTYAQQPAEFKDYRQLVMYEIALRYLVGEGQLLLPFDIDEHPVRVGIDYVRWSDSWDIGPRRFWTMGEADFDRLERELRAYRGTVEAQNFLPADKGQKADFCNYGSQCCLLSTEAAGGCAEPVEVNL